MNDEMGTTLSLTGLIKGRVQGVFFRAETQATAQRLGIQGWVRNTLEGHVEVLISGQEEAVQEMRSWLLQGPPRARVDSLELQECPGEDLQGFEIRY